MATGKVYTGCRARFMLNGKKIGYATGVTVREMIQFEPVKALDNIQTEEHVPIDYEVSMTADRVRLVGQSWKSDGFFPKQGATSADHLTNILASGELTATIMDSAEKVIVMNVEGVRISEVSMNVMARGVVGTNVSMVAIRARNESDK